MAASRPLLPLLPTRRTAPAGVANACFFRSGPQPGRRKALVQITERCDLRCAHCFVSATRAGDDMPLDRLTPAVMEQFVRARVANVTLTGGEPFVHPELLQIVARFIEYNIDVTICSNAVSISQDQMTKLVGMDRVQVNVSLDGLTAESHGRFRGNRESFPATMRNTRLLASVGLLKGILTTPNKLAAEGEYQRLNELARELQVQYLLMNPLSGFGRGYQSRHRLRAERETMIALQTELARLAQKAGDHELVFVRFPNDTQPLTRVSPATCSMSSSTVTSPSAPTLRSRPRAPGHNTGSRSSRSATCSARMTSRKNSTPMTLQSATNSVTTKPVRVVR